MLRGLSFHSLLVFSVCLGALCLSVSSTIAFCGMYVSQTSDERLLNEATHVVLYREGLTTSITMQNTYKGPVEDFAMLVPVPEVIKKDHVRVLPPETMERLARFTAPRLSAYEKRAGCGSGEGYRNGLLGAEKTGPSGPGRTSGEEASFGVTVLATFDVGEYEIKTLEASDSVGLLAWLGREKYAIPEGGEELLQGYINAGMYFFVARVNADKVAFNEHGEATLSPLRFTYSSKDFALPVRLGMLNADGPQDLLIHTISAQGRHESSSYATGIIPTNLVVQSEVQKNFASFYTSLYAHARQQQKAQLMTEFVGQMAPGQKCDPCTSDDRSLNMNMLYHFITLTEDVYDAQYRVRTQLIQDDGRHLRRSGILRRDMSRAMEEHCFNEEHVPLSGLATFSAAQELNLSVDELTGLMKIELGEYQGFDVMDTKALAAYQKCLRLAVYTFSSDQKALKHFEGTTLRITLRHHFARRLVIPQAPKGGAAPLVITRMRGTFSPEDTTEDIIFSLAEPLTGGYGSPDLVDDSMSSFYTEGGHTTQRFQARYVIIESRVKQDTKTCDEEIGWYTYWASPSPGAFDVEPMSVSERPTFSIKQLKRLIKNEEDAKLEL